jgi:nucleotide-binding universal stress UspA family protein
MTTGPIAVGTDGAPPSEAAVRWAAAEAAGRGVPLRIVYAYDQPGDPAEQLLAGAVLDAAARQAREAAPAAEVWAEAVCGDPAPVLLALDDVGLVVLGHRGRGGFLSLALGSVGRQVAAHATVPVVVVRGHAGAARGPIVAGVDESAAAEEVLDAAFTAAARHGCPLTVVHAYRAPTPLWAGAMPTFADGSDTLDATAEEQLDRRLAPWRARYPRVEAEAVVSADEAGVVLAAVSHRARLVVVGSRCHRAAANALLGSTGLHLLHHAGCPVLVVRPAAAASVRSGHGRAEG